MTNNLLSEFIIKGTKRKVTKMNKKTGQLETREVVTKPRNFVDLSPEELKEIVDYTIYEGLYKRENIL